MQIVSYRRRFRSRAAALASAFVLACLSISPARADLEISGTSNFTFGTWSGTGNLSDNYDVCIYVTAADGGPNYKIKASTGHDPIFKLSDGSGHYLPFTVYWNDQTGSTGQQEMTAGDATSIGVQSGADTSSPTCSGAKNSNLELRFSSSDMGSAIAGAYSGTLTLTLLPPL